MTYDVLSPDGIPISPLPPFKTKKSALEYYENWKERFKNQGYYLDKNRRKLTLDTLDNNCFLITYKGRYNPVNTKRISEL